MRDFHEWYYAWYSEKKEDGHIYAMQDAWNAALRASQSEAVEKAYLLGFLASGEGWNGEYPFRDNNRDPEQDKGWVTRRDKDLAYSPTRSEGKP